MNNRIKAEIDKQLFFLAQERLKELTGLDLTFDYEPVTKEYGEYTDAIARLQVATAEVLYIVETKRLLTTQNVEMAIRQVIKFAETTGLMPMLVATHINSNIGNRLQLQNICYIDTAGNAHLRGGNIYVDIKGQRPTEIPNKTRPIGRKGLQIVALLLAHPEKVNGTVRQLAHDADVALGTVTATLKELEVRGLLGRKRPKEYVIRDKQRLLELWMQGYVEVQRPHLLQHRYRLAPDIDLKELPAKLREAGAQNVLVGGEAAADYYTGYLRASGATLHIMGKLTHLPPRLLLPDARGNVDVLSVIGTIEMWQGPATGYVHPLLVYAELLATGGHDRRLAETAELLRENYLLAVDESDV